MKTLADFKRDIVPGKNIELVKIEEANIDGAWQGGDISNAPRGELVAVPIKERLQGIRTVTKKDTTGFYLQHQGEQGRGSFCGYPKAGQLSYDGARFTITETTKTGQAWQRRTYTLV